MNDLQTERDFVKVGHTGGLHGYDGSVRLNVASEISAQLNNDVAFLYFKENGMYVPRFIRSWDNEQTLVSFERLEAREEARILTDQEVYLRKKDLQKKRSNFAEDEIPWIVLVGYELWDVNSDLLMGSITGLEEYPAGWMAEVRKEDMDEFLLIPLAGPLIDRIDEKNEVLYMNLPEGLDEL